MNWRVETLDSITLISNSDPHSLHRLGREANILEVSVAHLSYAEIIRILEDKNPTEFVSTVEFFPEEGRYHLDGHADCKFSCEPRETLRLGGICPRCGKKLLRGVMSRVVDLAMRDAGYKPIGAVSSQSMVPLEEIIADCLGVGAASKKVRQLYGQALQASTEFEILLDMPEQDLSALLGRTVAEGVRRVRAGQVVLQAGYDGMYGHVHIFTPADRERFVDSAQAVLF